MLICCHVTQCAAAWMPECKPEPIGDGSHSWQRFRNVNRQIEMRPSPRFPEAADSTSPPGFSHPGCARMVCRSWADLHRCCCMHQGDAFKAKKIEKQAAETSGASGCQAAAARSVGLHPMPSRQAARQTHNQNTAILEARWCARGGPRVFRRPAPAGLRNSDGGSSPVPLRPPQAAAGTGRRPAPRGCSSGGKSWPAPSRGPSPRPTPCSTRPCSGCRNSWRRYRIDATSP